MLKFMQSIQTHRSWGWTMHHTQRGLSIAARAHQDTSWRRGTSSKLGLIDRTSEDETSVLPACSDDPNSLKQITKLKREGADRDSLWANAMRCASEWVRSTSESARHNLICCQYKSAQPNILLSNTLNYSQTNNTLINFHDELWTLICNSGSARETT